MTTWADLLADLRVDLKDTSTTSPRWSDDALFLWTRDAIRDYSMHLPITGKRAELSISGDSYPLPTDYLKVERVESPTGRFLEERGDRPGVRYYDPSMPYRFYIIRTNLYLDGPIVEGDDVQLTYTARHYVPIDTDDATTLTIPSDDEELIRLYVKAKAAEQFRTQQATLDRFKPAGSRDDNPMYPEAEALMSEYRRKVAERIAGGVVYLYRRGHGR